MTCEELERIFRKNRTLDHLVVLEDEAPVGLITRQNFFLKTEGPSVSALPEASFWRI